MLKKGKRMLYMLSNEKSSYGILSYDHQRSADYTLFLEAINLRGINGPFLFTIKKKNDVEKLRELHFIRSTGPDVVSDAFRKIIEEHAPDEAEFFDATITHREQKIEGFSCINLLKKTRCVDLEKSEFRLANFDPQHPDYMFDYTVMLDDAPSDVQIGRCAEQNTMIVVNEEIKQACFQERLSGLVFYRAIDMTYANRSVCEKI